MSHIASIVRNKLVGFNNLENKADIINVSATDARLPYLSKKTTL